MDELLKRCGTCKQLKPLYRFSKNKLKKDGLQNACKDCAKVRNTNYHLEHRNEILESNKVYRSVNPERIHESSQKYYSTHREERAAYHRNYHVKNRARELERSRKYRAANRDRLLENGRIYDKANRARHTDLKRQYRAKNPEKYKVYTQKRRSWKLSLPLNFDEQDWSNCLAYWHNRCAICGRAAGESTGYTLAADHWIPLSDPRPDNPGTVPGNILPLCHGTNGCNNSKKNAEPLHWLVRYLGTVAAEQKLLEITAYFDLLVAQPVNNAHYDAK